MDIRGLTLFISDVRKCANKEKETQRIDKELAKIRKYFNNPKLKGYDRKKCVCKLLYCYMLGYDFDFGHIEAIRLLASPKYSEKHIGYLACSILLHEKHDMLTLITQRCRADMCQPPVLPSIQSLALTCVGNIGGREMAESLIHDVQKVLISTNTHPLVRKKASLALLRLYRKNPELLPPDQWTNRVISLLATNDLGVVTALMSLLLTLARDNREAYVEVVPRVIRLLVTIVIQKDYMAKYLYYGSPAPWLQIKLLRILQYYPIPNDSALRQNISTVLDTNIDRAKRLSRLEGKKTSNRYNALHAVFFETLNLSIHYDSSQNQLTEGCTLLLTYVDAAEANLRYLALDTLSRLAYSQFTSIARIIQKKQRNILLCLKDADISIRRRSLDVLYAMCTKENADMIVGELLEYLPISDYGIREELVLKIAILAEKFASDLRWYVDVILSLIRECGDYVSDDIWFRVCQIVTNRKDVKLQKYTAETIFHAVSSPAAHEVCVKVAAYLIGEFGELIIHDIPPSKQLKVLVTKFETSSTKVKVILLNTFAKMFNVFDDDEYSEIRRKISLLFQKCRSNFDIEVQQRANEYTSLIEQKNYELMDKIFDVMPAYASSKNVVLEKLHKKDKEVSEVGIRQIKQKLTENDELNQGESPAKTNLELGEVENPSEDESEEDGKFISGNDGESSSEEEQRPEPVSVSGTSQRKKKKTAPPVVAAVDRGEDLLDFSSPVVSQIDQQTEEVTIDNILSLSSTKETRQDRPPPPSPGTGLGAFFDTTSSPSRNDQSEQNQNSIGFDLNPQATSLTHKYYLKLLIGKLGTVCEDSFLKVKVKQEFHDMRGRLGFYYENKTDSTLDISIEVDNKNVEGAVAMEYTKVGSIAPNSSVAQYFKVMCLSAFSDPPKVSVFYNSSFNKKMKLDFLIPISCHKFFSGLEISGKDEFFKLWGSISKEEPYQIAKIFKVEKGLSILQGLREVVKNGFQLKVYDGVAPNDAINVIAGGKFHSKRASGENDLVFCRVQINVAKKAARVTTKCSNGIVNQQFFKNLHEQILLL